MISKLFITPLLNISKNHQTLAIIFLKLTQTQEALMLWRRLSPHEILPPLISQNRKFSLSLPITKKLESELKARGKIEEYFSCNISIDRLFLISQIFTIPSIVVKWRHWGHFRGNYKDYLSTGETIEIIGISIVKVSDDLKILSLEHYYENTKFLDSLTSGGKVIAEKQQKSSGETQTSNSLQHKFMGFIKNFLGVKKKSTSF